MVAISCSTKLWAFSLAEQMQKNGKLDALFTSYAYQKNIFLRKLVKRIDKEEIPADKIHTNTVLAFPIKLMPSRAHVWNNLFDHWVAGQINKSSSKIFIGWSGMSLHAIRAAKKNKMITIVERGSTHIEYQDEILQEEYRRFGIKFFVHPAVIEKELQEYEEADYISVPSLFVKKTFLEKKIPEGKLIMNPFGASSFFKPGEKKDDLQDKKFKIVYLGTLSIRKGLIYLFEALHLLSIPENEFEVLFIGSVEKQLEPFIEKFKKANWKFYGHINHYELPQYLSQVDVGVQPSLEEGLSMVIPQLLACAVPMIVTPNTGGENIVTDGYNGFIIPVRSPQAIAEKIELLYHDKQKLLAMKQNATEVIKKSFTWDDYGNRYNDFINKLVAQ